MLYEHCYYMVNLSFEVKYSETLIDGYVIVNCVYIQHIVLCVVRKHMTDREAMFTGTKIEGSGFPA